LPEPLTECPFCNVTDCKHEVLAHSVCNSDWSGPLADRTGALGEKIESALCEYLSASARGRGEPSFPMLELIERAGDEFDGDAESLEGLPALRTYWIDLAGFAAGATVVEVDLDGGGPGMSDTFIGVYFEKPASGIKAVLAAAKRDLAFLQSEVARGQKKSKAAR
jgi:hypothetical protein